MSLHKTFCFPPHLPDHTTDFALGRQKALWRSRSK